MNPGKLNKRITLQRFEKIKDSEGIVTEAWNDVATVWASAEPLRGREYFAAAAVNRENTVRFRIRYKPDVSSDMRIKYDGRFFDIQSVIDVNERHKELHLMAEEVQNSGS